MLGEGKFSSNSDSGFDRRKMLMMYRDGHYGLWLDDNLEKGVSSSCPTFGNEPLSDEGKKFSILGVELWYVGA